MSKGSRFTCHEDYIAAATPGARVILLQVQAVVEAALPGITRCISYNMPAYRAGKVFFYFAAFQRHLGVYPPVTQDAALIQSLSPFRNEKGNLAFPYRDPIPYELIGRVAVALAREYAGLPPPAAGSVKR